MSCFRVGWGSLVLVLGACAPMTTLRTARITEPGKWEVGGSLGAISIPRLRQLGAGDYPGHLDVFERDLPVASVGARRGLLDWLDVGARLGLPASLELEAGLGVAEGAWAVALAPSLGALWSAGYGVYLDAQLPLLVSVGLVPGRPRLVELTVGAVGRLEAQVGDAGGAWEGYDSRQWALYAGALAGVSVQLGVGLFLRLEAIWLRPVFNSAPPVPELPIFTFDAMHSNFIQVSLASGWTF